MYISLDKIKRQLNLDSNYKEEDCMIIDLYNVAEEIVKRHIDCPDLKQLLDEKGDLPAPLNQAILLLIGNFYIQRESISDTPIYNVPNSYEYILSLYQNYYPSMKNNE